MHGNFYGTHKRQVEEAQKHGKICVLDIDIKGAIEIAQNGKTPCNFLFIKPPSIEDLRERLAERGTETEESLAKRIANAEVEIRMAEEHPEIFNKFIINNE